ncbi:substrate-binding domain-containing protein [Streptomyces sp. NTH33]|uniref:substrate-binding domain-containing protein n=1 Tax=Streptomyces sp. NTH33 TaxID=1735453 RepID=UPI0021AC1478|nr:substrate-binding domain-containing protein [Streptomyces sp. NTH33]
MPATEPGCAYRELSALEPVEFMEFGTIEAVKRAAAAGLGIALLPEVTVATELAESSLARLFREPPFTLRTQLARRSGKRLPVHARLFVEQARRLVCEQA